MYSVEVDTDFEALHFLAASDKQEETVPHAHRYRVSVKFEGAGLNEYGYLVDIEHIDRELKRVAASFAGKLLNESPAFSGYVPSIEHFARIVCLEFALPVAGAHVSAVTVTIGENEKARASYLHCLADGPGR